MLCSISAAVLDQPSASGRPQPKKKQKQLFCRQLLNDCLLRPDKLWGSLRGVHRGCTECKSCPSHAARVLSLLSQDSCRLLCARVLQSTCRGNQARDD